MSRSSAYGCPERLAFPLTMAQTDQEAIDLAGQRPAALAPTVRRFAVDFCRRSGAAALAAAAIAGGMMAGTAPTSQPTDITTVAMVEGLAPQGPCVFSHHGGKHSGCWGGSFWPGTSSAWKSTPAPLPASCANYQMQPGPPSASIPPQAQPQLYCQPGMTGGSIPQGCLVGAGLAAGGLLLAPPTGGASLAGAGLGAAGVGYACH